MASAPNVRRGAGVRPLLGLEKGLTEMYVDQGSNPHFDEQAREKADQLARDWAHEFALEKGREIAEDAAAGAFQEVFEAEYERLCEPAYHVAFKEILERITQQS